jgi:hypothetical protein
MEREFRDVNQNLNVTFSSNDVTFSDNVAVNNGSLLFLPPYVSFAASSVQLMATFPPFKVYPVTASIRDSSNVTAECTFDLYFKREYWLITVKRSF